MIFLDCTTFVHLSFAFYFWIIKRTRAYQTRVPYYKELELGKLEYCVAWNSSLPSSSSMWHFFNKKIQVSTSFFMKLECLILDLHSKLEFHELEFQKSGILLLIL